MAERNQIGIDEMVFYYLGVLIVILICVLLNTVLLTYAAKIVLKRKPPFGKAFRVSLASIAFAVIGRMIVAEFNQVNRRSGASATDASLWFADLFPIVVFLLGSWLVNSAFLEKADLVKAGYGSGAAVTLINALFLLILGIVLGLAAVLLTA